ncbi:hypothetical protein PIB30_035188 [Stylosanthes scabra]|uniref:Uncharacterized protein n=1 Tax=Stylosanthes scabra TaxID=79078 RepID=A0ABU6ZCD8_9FABA|nr:hypothetical protein [Stylosanthes scabra]
MSLRCGVSLVSSYVLTCRCVVPAAVRRLCLCLRVGPICAYELPRCLFPPVLILPCGVRDWPAFFLSLPPLFEFLICASLTVISATSAAGAQPPSSLCLLLFRYPPSHHCSSLTFLPLCFVSSRSSQIPLRQSHLFLYSSSRHCRAFFFSLP